jgi:hypothetical protein
LTSLNVNLSAVSRASNDNSDVHADNYDEDKEPFSLEEIYIHLFYGFRFNGTWISDTEIIIPDVMDGELAIYDVKTRQTKQIFEGQKLPVRKLLSGIRIAFLI